MPYVKRFARKKPKKREKKKPNKEINYDLWLTFLSPSSLREELDRVFSLWIRQKNADHRGYASCVTCGKKHFWRDLHCGHYISRTHSSTRWEEKNCHPQDVACNIFKKGNISNYAIYLTRTYGQQILELLEIKKNNVWKAAKFEYIALIKEYIQKLIDNKLEIK